MALRPTRHSQSDESFTTVHENGHGYGREDEHDGDDELGSLTSDDETGVPPVHPVPALQSAFEESIVEAAEKAMRSGVDEYTQHTPESPQEDAGDGAEARRQHLLDLEEYDESWNKRWKQKDSAKHHPLVKLAAQVIFGLHLLQQRQAKSDAAVIDILQAHVDEIDMFLEKTTEDFDLALKDIKERTSLLQLPMKHLDVFDIMLDDKTFRTQLVEGNDKIDKIVERTARAMNAAILDIDRGLYAVDEMASYLDASQSQWPPDATHLSAIYEAMRGNQEGWLSCMHEVREVKATALASALLQLGTIIAHISKLAAAASRRNKAQSHNVTDPDPIPRSRYSNSRRPSSQLANYSINKPLPSEPYEALIALKRTPPKQRVAQPPETPGRRNADQSRRSSCGDAYAKMRTADAMLPPFTMRRHSGPLSSHPPITSDGESPPAAVVDSAYSSGSDPRATPASPKRAHTPARFGLFPDSKPTTPDRVSRRTVTPTPSPAQASLHPSPTSMTLPPEKSKNRYFSLRKMFRRKSKTPNSAV